MGIPVMRRRGNVNHAAVMVAAAATTWDPANKGSGLVLSNGNLTATGGGSDWDGTRSTTSHNSGKWYFETDGHGSGTCVVGFANSTENVAAVSYFPGRTTNSIGLFSTGAVYNNNTVIDSIEALNAGAVNGFAVDIDAGKVWFRTNGGWNGDPAAGTGGYSFASGTIYASIGRFSADNPITGKFASGSLTNTPPSGFTAWG